MMAFGAFHYPSISFSKSAKRITINVKLVKQIKRAGLPRLARLASKKFNVKKRQDRLK
jgi:hypothetical protein